MNLLLDDGAAAGGDVGVRLLPIAPGDCEAVGAFLNQHLNKRISAEAWASAMRPTWAAGAPNHGFMLVQSGAVVGAQLAFYATRRIGGRQERVCNLAALCVLPAHRQHALRLVRAVLAQPGWSFTDLSPSGNVPALNARLGFQPLDTSTALIPNLPWSGGWSRLRLETDLDAIAARLTWRDRQIFADHRDAAAARHLLLLDGPRYCYVMFRKDRRKNLPLFASLLYVSDLTLFARGSGLVFRHLLLKHRLLFTLAEVRLIRRRPALSMLLRRPRTKMFRSTTLGPDDIDYLYSELTAVSW